MEKTVCELFAGVGGFRLGFERDSKEWKTVWFSQWEPGKKRQYAWECYRAHWPEDVFDERTGEDISTVDKETIPDHNLLVGGFPCQDYSVAHSLSGEKGIEGKKGVLWWQIRDILRAKKPAFCLFENVDRLLKSPAKQRGRDFGLILATLAENGYCCEWRVINAAEYGEVQRRRRTFIFAYKQGTKYGNEIRKQTPENIITREGFFASTFPVADHETIKTVKMEYDDIVDVSDHFQYQFENAGYMRFPDIYTCKTTPKLESPKLLGHILEKNVDEKYYVTDFSKWAYLKGSKHINRKAKTGHEYTFSEGAIAFPDPWDRPARTMLTSESSLNRTTHIVCDPGTGRLRTLTPVETERIQGFDDNWTKTGDTPEKFRYFEMGNALVVPLITRMAKKLASIFKAEG